MKCKKNPQRFSIQFDQSIPEHNTVIEILIKKGRFASRYIADAILFYENNKNDSLEGTVTQIVSKMLGLTAVVSPGVSEQTEPLSPNETVNAIDYKDVAMDLEGFKK